MSFDFLNTSMHWPSAKEVYSPSGAGSRILVKLAKEKIEKNLARQLGKTANVKVGLLTKTAGAAMTASPIAVVCEFNHPITKQHLAEAHRLAWNFSRAPLLITIEPNLIRTWSCCELPASNTEEVEQLGFQIREATLDFGTPDSLSDSAAHALNWVRLASGDFYREFPERFRRAGRADQALLDELKAVRKELERQELPRDTIHDLIARVIFIQFLFDRKDSEGRSALNPSLLEKLYNEGTLRGVHVNLQSILANFKEAYRFFQWLNDKFNGDLFPGKGETKTGRETEWRNEKNAVEEHHLKTLADFVSGTLKVKDRQRLFWRQYSFDVIPLEFISSVYEEFVTSNSAHYTPGFLVDFMLDGVLPWDGDEWDLKILDPACGSGIFLVKAYQRLIQRWKNANENEQPSPNVLRRILERNLFGVDIDPHAVRVASFSLYLTMCDEIDPKSYLSVWKFPRMRGERLIHSDFFAEGIKGFDTGEDVSSYDLIIGNAPWGKDTVTDAAEAWANDPNHKWPIANKAIGTLFLAKSGELAKSTGLVSLIQPASSLLFNSIGTSVRFRQMLFSNYSVKEIVNLSALRFQLFGVARRATKSTSPPCVVTFSPTVGESEPILYISPKKSILNDKSETGENDYWIIVEPFDISLISHADCIDASTWTAFSWGGRRDYFLIQKLQKFTSLKELESDGTILSRRGVSRGKNKQKRQEGILDMPMVSSDDDIDENFKFLNAASLSRNSDPFTHEADSVDMSAFSLPQLIVKQSWQKRTSRFKCLIVNSTPSLGPVFCTRSYFSIHVAKESDSLVEQIWTSINSSIAVYFLLLTSGRLASWIPEPNKKDFLNIPIAIGGKKSSVESVADIDRKATLDFDLKDSESVLVSDLFKFTMPDFQGNDSSPGRQFTQRNDTSKRVSTREPEVSQYCKFFLRVLKSVSGDEQSIRATIFQDSSKQRLPVRLVAFYLDMDRSEEITVETIDSDELCFLLDTLNETYLKIHGVDRGGIFFQRVARIYLEQEINGVLTPVVYIVKPDRVRYWTRSAGLRDADEVAADAQISQSENPPSYDEAEA